MGGPKGPSSFFLAPAVTRTSEALRHSNNGQALATTRADMFKEARMPLVLTLWLIYVPLLLALAWLMSKEDNT